MSLLCRLRLFVLADLSLRAHRAEEPTNQDEHQLGMPFQDSYGHTSSCTIENCMLCRYCVGHVICKRQTAKPSPAVTLARTTCKSSDAPSYERFDRGTRAAEASST